MSGTRGTQLHALRPGHVRVREVALEPERKREREREREDETARVRVIIGDPVTSCRVVFPVDSLPPHRVQLHRFTLVIMRYQSDDITRAEHEAAWHG